MPARSQKPVDGALKALSGALDDVKAGAKSGAVKGAAAGALGVLGAKAAEAAQGAGDSHPRFPFRTQASRRQTRRFFGRASSNNGGSAQPASVTADASSKPDTLAGVLQILAKRVAAVSESVADDGRHLTIDLNDVPRLLQGVSLIATGLGTLFAPGSALDVTKRLDASDAQTGDDLTGQARHGLDVAADLTQQRIKNLVDMAREALASISDALTASVESTESKMQEVLDETEARLTHATEQVADTARETLPSKRGGGWFRWLFSGLLVGGGAAFLSSPFSGPVGERIANLRRDLGLGGDQDDESQYWPTSPPESKAPTDQPAAGGDASSLGKTEAWSDADGVKENTDKA